LTRRRGFVATLNQIQRDVERAKRANLRQQTQAAREAERAQRAYERATVADEKERRRLYSESRSAAVASKNADLDVAIARLEGVLLATLAVDDYLDFETLKERPATPPFDPGPLAQPEPEPRPPPSPPEPRGLSRLSRGAKESHAAQVQAVQSAHSQALADHAARERHRQASLERARVEYDGMLASDGERIAAQHAEVDELRRDFDAGLPEAVVTYFTLVLSASAYPDGFPKHARLAFVPESRQLVVEYGLPPFAVIPEVGQYRYIKARDEVTPTTRPASQRRALYASVVAQTTLRTIHELFEADRGRHLDTVVFNGYVSAVDRGTGRTARPCLVTVRTSRDEFGALDLSMVEPTACLKALSASFSKSPAELAPVRPVLEFSMVDPRFVEETDVLSGLDQRPNLMELTPSEFESLITNLFEKMGLQTRLTQASRDGGVDCVAYDPRPIFGGKVVIQAKRYKHTVGVSAVRDLFGTMQNEGASKGILVTTSGYGKASSDFAAGKPIELLSGSHLLYLLAEHAGIEAKIEPPEDWADPVPEY